MEKEEQQEYDEFLEENKQRIDNIIRTFRELGIKKICLEGGHIYTDEPPAKQHFYSIKVTSFLKKVFEGEGFEVTTLLLVDDYNPLENDGFSLEEYLDSAREIGLDFEHVLMESEMVDIAKIMLQTLENLNLVTEREGMKILGKNKANLIDAKTGKFSCALLDAALTILKLKNFGDCTVNVLERSYKSQQRNVKRILGELSPNERELLFSFFI